MKVFHYGTIVEVPLYAQSDRTLERIVKVLFTVCGCVREINWTSNSGRKVRFFSLYTLIRVNRIKVLLTVEHKLSTCC
jgi:hypothetical protein